MKNDHPNNSVSFYVDSDLPVPLTIIDTLALQNGKGIRDVPVGSGSVDLFIFADPQVSDTVITLTSGMKGSS